MVTTITAVSLLGTRRMARNDSQLNVLIDTMIITATRAAIGMRASCSRSPSTRISKPAPAVKVERR